MLSMEVHMSRPADPERLAKMVEAAHLYFDEDKTKTEIAKLFKTSVTEVNRLLDDARRGGYVQITIVPPTLLGLQRKLQDRWDLKTATVIPGYEDYKFQRRLLGRATAQHIEQRLNQSNVKRVAVSGGQTMWEAANAVGPIERKVEIVPTALIGRGGRIDHADPTLVVTQLFEKGQGVTASFATVLPLEKPVSEAIKDAQDEQKQFLTRTKIKNVFDKMLDADVVYSGVGLVEESGEEAKQTPAIKFLDEIGITVKHLQAEGAVGDINYSFFNSKGEALPHLDVFISLTVTHLKDMVQNGKEVVLTAGHKPSALRAVLRGGLCSHLITDEQTASKLCE
jgi:deoxyribonucleoside regulator